MAFDNDESRHAANESQQGAHGRNYFHFCFNFFSQFLAYRSAVMKNYETAKDSFCRFCGCCGRDPQVPANLVRSCSTYS